MKGKNQKLKMLYLAEIFRNYTDEKHGLTFKEIQAMLKDYDVSADRKTLYGDFEELRHYGMDITNPSEEQLGAYANYRAVNGRLFGRNAEELSFAEVKLLVDIVQSTKFITEDKSNKLIKKLENLVSRYQAQELNREIITSGRVKSDNEQVFDNIDSIQLAMNNDIQVEFKYYMWNVNRKLIERHPGKIYKVSPWALVFDDENYYLLGYQEDEGIIKHYRVDKIQDINITDRKRNGEEEFHKQNMAKYTSTMFGMYHGEIKDVVLEAENSMAGVIIDRFGRDTVLRKQDDNHFQVTVQVAISQQFIGWLIGLGNKIKVIEPESVVEKMRDRIRELNETYGM
ncbi:MAG: WYL domain-containing protein [Clostridia bacterium]|nr:WYL domain-containing protein [Clostridia bacterium]